MRRIRPPPAGWPGSPTSAASSPVRSWSSCSAASGGRRSRGGIRPRGETMVRRRWLLAGAGLLALGLVDACWLERRMLLVRQDVRLAIPGAPKLRFVQLSDLHIDG